MNRSVAVEGSAAHRSGSKQILTRRRGACDGTRPCDQCYRLGRECIYKQTRSARHGSQGHGISSRASFSEHLTHPTGSEQTPTLDKAHSPPRPFLSTLEYQQNLPHLMTDMSWEQLDIQNFELTDASKVSMDFFPSSVTALVTPSNHTSCGALSPTSEPGAFDGALYSPRSSILSSELLESPLHRHTISESTQQVVSYSEAKFAESNDEGHSRKFPDNMRAGDQCASTTTGLPGPSEMRLPNMIVTTPITRFCIGSAFTLSQFDDDILKAEFMLGAFSSFIQLEPRQYEHAQGPDVDLKKHTYSSYSRVILDDVLEACHNEPAGLASFLSFTRLKRILSVILEDQPTSPVENALMYSAIAIGFHLRAAEQRKGDDSSGPFFQHSLHALGDVLLAKDTLLKLQSLVTMLIYARTFGLRCFSTLMTNAVSCAQNLRLNYKSGILALISDPEEQAWATRTFWYLYTLTQPYCLRWGLPLVIDDAYIDLDIPKPSNSANMNSHDVDDHLLLQIRYAKLCSQIKKAQYDHNLFVKPFTALDRVAGFLHQQLDAWTSEIPDELWSKDIPGHNQIYHRRMHLQLRLQYYEALLALDSLFLHPRNIESEDLNEHRNQGLKQCVQTAKTVLEDYEAVQIADFLVNRALALPLFVAVRIIFLAVVLNWSDDNEISYLAIACGLFGRLSMGFEVPLAEFETVNKMFQKGCQQQK
ncbi:hypothetical protein B7463_g10567, partial [Scytalidium lignicola]